MRLTNGCTGQISAVTFLRGKKAAIKNLLGEPGVSCIKGKVHVRTNVRFRTEKFKLLQDENKPFPAIELAGWLVDRFKNEFNLDYLDEDNYCMLFLGNPVEAKLEGACGHVESNVWQILMHLKPSFFDKLLKRTLPTDLQRKFLISLDELLHSDSEITDIEWYEENSKLQEFNHGAHAVS